MARPMPLDAPVTMAVLPARGRVWLMRPPWERGFSLTAGTGGVNGARRAVMAPPGSVRLRWQRRDDGDDAQVVLPLLPRGLWHRGRRRRRPRGGRARRPRARRLAGLPLREGTRAGR